MATIIQGTTLAKELQVTLKKEIEALSYKPHLVAVQIGDDQASTVYLKKKRQMCEKLGIQFTLLSMEAKEEITIMQQKVREVCQDDKVHGVIIQLPLPNHILEDDLLHLVPMEKDVDGLSAIHIGNCLLKKVGIPCIRPATPWGIVHMIKSYAIQTKGQHIVVIGKSRIVGTPLSLLLSQECSMAGTVTMCDRYTNNLKDIVKDADILVVAAGKHHLIGPEYEVKPTCAMIDVGIHRRNVGGKTCLQGDIDFEHFKTRCASITPVPGGVGPMTVISLMRNVFIASLP